MANEPRDVFRFYTMDAGREDGCWVWNGPTGGPATRKRPYFTCEGERHIAYRLVYQLVHGVELRSDQPILHSCDNGDMPVGCGNPAHLRIGTHDANMQDMMNRERHGLPANTVKVIKRLIAEGREAQVIADLYGVSRELVMHIKHGRAYRQVKDDG